MEENLKYLSGCLITGGDLEPYVRDVMAAPMWNSRVQYGGWKRFRRSFSRPRTSLDGGNRRGFFECGSSRDRRTAFGMTKRRAAPEEAARQRCVDGVLTERIERRSGRLLPGLTGSSAFGSRDAQSPAMRFFSKTVTSKAYPNFVAVAAVGSRPKRSSR